MFATTGDRRGQAYTLEAVIAAILVLSGLVFALQVTAVTPLSASTSSQHIENQERATAAGALAAAEEAEALKAGILFWNDSSTDAGFHDATRGDHYTNDFPSNTFGEILNRSFAGRGVAVNVFVVDEEGNRQRMIYNGAPSDNAVSADRTVTLFDDDHLRNADGSLGPTLTATTGFYVDSDGHAGSQVYEVVTVEVVVWRM